MSGRWHVRIQIFCNEEERAERRIKGLREAGLQNVRKESGAVVSYTRDVLDQYAADPMSAAFFAMQQVWDKWPEGEPRPSSRFTCTVNYKPPTEDA